MRSVIQFVAAVGVYGLRNILMLKEHLLVVAHVAPKKKIPSITSKRTAYQFGIKMKCPSFICPIV